MQEEEEEIEVAEESDVESEWAPDPRAVEEPTEYRFQTWDTTCLGSYIWNLDCISTCNNVEIKH